MFGQALVELSLFENLTPDQMKRIEGMTEILPISQGQTIFEQGEKARYLYVLISGEVIIRFKPYDGSAITVARINPGGVFGWSAALGRAIYTSAAFSMVDSTALRFSGKELQGLCDCDPDIGTILLQRLANIITERIKNTQPQIMSILSQGLDADGECKKRISQNGHPE